MTLQNQRNLQKIYKSLHDDEIDFNNLSFLQHTEDIIKTIETYTENLEGRKRYYSSIMASIPNKQSELYKIYRKEYDKYAKLIKKEIEQNLLSEYERKNIINWNIIINKIKPIILKKGTTREKLLIKFYTDIPPRRGEFTQYLKLSKQDTTPTDENYNYFMYNTGKIILNKYKTKQLYKKQILQYPKIKLKGLNRLLDEYDDGDLIFGRSKSQPYKSYNLVSPMFKKYTDNKKVGIRLLRHAFITDYVKSKKVLSIKQQKNIAKQLGHSTIEFQKYIRLDIK